MKNISKVLLAFTFIALFSCNQKTTYEDIEGFDYGNIKENTYINKFFNIEMAIPDKWVVQNTDEMKELMKFSKEKSGKNNKELDKIFKVAEITTANLLMVFRNAPGTTTSFNPNFVLSAENLQNNSIRTAKEYITQAKKTLESISEGKTSITQPDYKIRINGIDFDSLILKKTINNMAIEQTMLCTVKKDFAIIFIYSYDSADQKAEIEKRVVNTIAPYKA
ncbi:MAG: hypothetical protein DI539_11870 [Flavobacterium psychrophilum]|nr:MAG: hypothetical protein DI539_11870 [Flavobacterium psychrophilum]